MLVYRFYRRLLICHYFACARAPRLRHFFVTISLLLSLFVALLFRHIAPPAVTLLFRRAACYACFATPLIIFALSYLRRDAATAYFAAAVDCRYAAIYCLRRFALLFSMPLLISFMMMPSLRRYFSEFRYYVWRVPCSMLKICCYIMLMLLICHALPLSFSDTLRYVTHYLARLR